MHTLQMMFYITIFTCITLFLLTFVECSSYERNREASHHKNISRQVMNPQKTYDMALHGILLWASIGFLMPVGILTIRMSSTKGFNLRRHKILFYVHAILQVISVLLATIGAALSIRNFENAFNNSHQRIGLALYGAIYVQVLVGFKRPKRGTRDRSRWYLLHWILGTTISLVGNLNIYTGLHAYHKRTSKSSKPWIIIFTAQISFMAILYLVQDKWDYMKKQRVAENGDTIISQVELDNQKDKVDEPSRKSNALGTHFSRNTALNKLFQLT
ncbi:cytochrome b561 domain-containing protein At4g18260-like [Henckelia pumila]|uniref:cytochrome b561 domain-containing protein At4g18260-like n=1 Tax=Henckelia pumila TaxID=405737 RepID=UPI003C6E16CA